jgi:hypothetical protein
MTNPITEEIRTIRHQLAAKFENKLDLIVADLLRQQQNSDREIVDRSQHSSNPSLLTEQSSNSR